MHYDYYYVKKSKTISLKNSKSAHNKSRILNQKYKEVIGMCLLNEFTLCNLSISKMHYNQTGQMFAYLQLNNYMTHSCIWEKQNNYFTTSYFIDVWLSVHMTQTHLMNQNKILLNKILLLQDSITLRPKHQYDLINFFGSYKLMANLATWPKTHTTQKLDLLFWASLYYPKVT